MTRSLAEAAISRSRLRAGRGTGDALYATVARILRDEIVSGKHPVGSQLPTEAVLRARFGVSRHTIRDAVRMLRDEGLLASRQGAGTIVLPQPAAEAFVLEAQTVDDLVAYSAEMYTEVFSTGMEHIDASQAARIGVAPGDEWLVVRGSVHSLQTKEPICWSEYYIHRDFAAVGRLLKRKTGPIFLLIEDMFGLSMTELDQEISAGPMPASIAASLERQPPEIAILVRRSFATAEGKTAQISLHTHPASSFRQTMKMRRQLS